jgi:AcrR family transcriptional regulator
MQRNAGRPPTPGLSEALLQAAERIMVHEGFESLTVDRLVTEVGTTRPTFYRRFPSVAALAFDIIRQRFGTGTPVDTGSLQQDLLILQREDIAMFSSPLLQRNLPGLLLSMRVDPEIRDRYRNEFVEPRRANVRDLVLAAADRGEIPSDRIDIEYVCDLLLGPLLARTLLPLDGPLDDRLARATVQTVIDHLAMAPVASQTAKRH